MTIGPLEAFRKDFAGCEMVVFADIVAKTVLAWDGALKWPQEPLDDLCEMAAQVLAIGADVDPLAEPQTAIFARATGCFVFLRATPGASEALCCVCAPDCDISQAFTEGKALCADLLSADQRMKG